ncbi:hypothetical protein L1080_029460 [Rhodococcus sp. MSC1_016]
MSDRVGDRIDHSSRTHGIPCVRGRYPGCRRTHRQVSLGSCAALASVLVSALEHI